MALPVVDPFACIILMLLFHLALPNISHSVEKPDHHCDDQASWQQWNKLLADAPNDDGVAALYAFRIGLCSMVKTGKIETDRATKLFEAMRDTVLRRARESQEQDAKDKGI